LKPLRERLKAGRDAADTFHWGATMKKTFSTSTLVLALAVSSLSQQTTNVNFPEAPSAIWNGPNPTGTTLAPSGTAFVPPTLAIERNTNKSWHTLDRKFILLQTFSTMALLADLETTARGLAQQPRATELNPLFGKDPSRARLYGIAVPLNIFPFYLSYHSKKIAPRRSVWKVGPEMCIAVHTAAAINNVIVTRR
jgi:hypothetical protein